MSLKFERFEKNKQEETMQFTYPAPMYPDVTTASPGPRKMHVKLKRLSRPVCTLSENCTVTMLVIVSPYCHRTNNEKEQLQM